MGLGWRQWAHDEPYVAWAGEGHIGNEWVFGDIEGKCSCLLLKLWTGRAELTGLA